MANYAVDYEVEYEYDEDQTTFDDSADAGESDVNSADVLHPSVAGTKNMKPTRARTEFPET